eukprot:GEMP01001098.1.p1 GENE.GEMP01001098.1~~GEMP01001098.1.p1  ORF type:complete len:374 (+),score=96.52 GEMP01001098.1:93-1214(+)
MCARLESREPASDARQSTSGKATGVAKNATNSDAARQSTHAKDRKVTSVMPPIGKSDSCNTNTSDNDNNGGDSSSSSSNHCHGPHCAVVTTSLYCSDIRGRTLTRAALQPRAASWHPCLRVRSPCAAQRINGHCQHVRYNAHGIVASGVITRLENSKPAPRPPGDDSWRLHILACADQKLNGRYRTTCAAPVCDDRWAEDGGTICANHVIEEDKFRDNPLTMMLRNYPRNRSQEQLFSELQESALHDSFDFLYLPTADSKAKTNKGYAFVNFKTTDLAFRFYELWHKTWYPTHMRRPMTVAPAEVQGWDANIQRCFENASRITKVTFFPIVYDSAGYRVNILDLSPHRTLVVQKPLKEPPKRTRMKREALRSV